MNARLAWTVVLALLPVAALGASKVPPARLNTLTRGTNLGAYRYWKKGAVPLDLAKSLKAAGFRHVRYPVNPAALWDAPAGDLSRAALLELDQSLDNLLKAGLAVIVDPHDPPKPWWAEEQGTFVRFWSALAKHLSVRSPDKVFLETCNEPLCDTPQIWNALQERLLDAMRRGAPKHTLIATPNYIIKDGNWDQLACLKTLQPVGDGNVVYNVHFYEPFLFTHQGSTWSWDVVAPLKDVPYPSSPEAVAPLLAGVPAKSRPFLENYGRERWDGVRIGEALKPFAQWGREHGVPLTCNEWGVYIKASPEPDRLRWYRDTKAALESLGFRWCIWDDGGGFGVTRPEGGGWKLDTTTLRALGLK